MSMVIIGDSPDMKNNIFDPEYLKVTSNIILSYAYDAVNNYPEPNREEYDTEEDYKKAYNDYLMYLLFVFYTIHRIRYRLLYIMKNHCPDNHKKLN